MTRLEDPPHTPFNFQKPPLSFFFYYLFLFLFFLKTKIIVGCGRPWLKVDKTGHSLLCIVKRIISPLKEIYIMRNIWIFDTISFHMVLLLAPLLELSECRMISDFCFSVSVLSCRLYRHHLENKIKLNNHQMLPPLVSLLSQWFYHSMPSSHHFMVSFVQWQVPQTYQAFYVSGVRINNSYWYDISTLTTLPPQP